MKQLLTLILIIFSASCFGQTIPVKSTDSLYIIETKVTVISKVVPPANPINHSPTAFSGNTQTITLPVNSIVLNGTANDVDNNIKTTVWTKSTSLASTIVSPNSLSTSVTGLAQGTHIFKLTVTDDSGAVASSTVNIIVNAAPPPVDTTGGIKNEGYGFDAVGGSNSSTVYHVTNTSTSGTGSLMNGIGSNRTILFDIDGTFYATRLDLANISYLTIDGNGHNVILDNHTSNGGVGPGGDVVSFDGSNTHHCILRNIHVINSGVDGINVVGGAHHILITNCASYFSGDGAIDIAASQTELTKFVSVQFCIMGVGKAGWGGDMLITAQNVSAHHNLFAPLTNGVEGERCPLVHSNYSPSGLPNADIRNNIMWQWGRGTNGTGSGYATAIAYKSTANVVGNYMYDKESASNAIANGDGYGTGATGQIYSFGNVITNGTSTQSSTMANNHADFNIPAQNQVTTTDACTAARLVLSKVGPLGNGRNEMDMKYINAVTLPNCPAQ